MPSSLCLSSERASFCCMHNRSVSAHCGILATGWWATHSAASTGVIHSLCFLQSYFRLLLSRWAAERIRAANFMAHAWSQKQKKCSYQQFKYTFHPEMLFYKLNIRISALSFYLLHSLCAAQDYLRKRVWHKKYVTLLTQKTHTLVRQLFRQVRDIFLWRVVRSAQREKSKSAFLPTFKMPSTEKFVCVPLFAFGILYPLAPCIPSAAWRTST
jgi:hypothetical protein